MSKSVGSFVISLDFEMFWGVLGNSNINQYKDNLVGVHSSIPEILKIFEKYKIHSTWATVGFLFFSSKSELTNSLPDKKPSYTNSGLSPYKFLELNKLNNKNKSIYFAKDLIDRISCSDNQEIGSHTFSHYYCLEDGQKIEEFKSDMLAAKNIAKKFKLNIASLVFPRNQVNADYLSICSELNITSYRGNPLSWLYRNGSRNDPLLKRALRLVDTYINISGYNTYIPSNKFDKAPLNIQASSFLRPYSKHLRYFEYFKLRRITSAMTHAAKTGKTYHLWWHPHNFGINLQKNMDFLTKVLDHYLYLEEKYHMKSMNMNEIYSQYNFNKNEN
jgi:peptidoglycan/xylan/chitin deacetylase (PgdA/CDA1 family)